MRTSVDRLAPKIDRYFFIKRGYAPWRHVIPFGVAALLLVLLSVPKDNLLLELAARLDQPGWLVVPAALLTVTTGGVYLAGLLTLVRQAYLWPQEDWPRTLITAGIYAVVCSALALLIVTTAPSSPGFSFGSVWASVMVALLSLTGLGWSLPTDWVESIGLALPDYAKGRVAARQLAKALAQARAQSVTTETHINETLIATEALIESIRDNEPLEPAWSQSLIAPARQALQTYALQTKQKFVDDKGAVIGNFGSASRCEPAPAYQDYIAALRKLGEWWPELRCPG